MGSINRILKPIYWKICLEGESKIIEDDIIYKMIIGNSEDYDCCEIIEFISKNNYENILNGNYTIKVFPYSELPVLLFDEEQNLIPLVNGTEIPFLKLNSAQKNYIYDKVKKRSLIS